tara:strand:+ start:134 stop:502 length:369 start_codon:yes stop_codon:yes gene_type:complete
MTTTTPRTIHVAIELDHEFLSDVLTTAVSGGITYWADVTEHAKDLYEIAPNVEMRMEFEPQALSSDHIAIGIRKAMERTPGCAMHIRRRITQAVQYQDASCIDAGDADVIVQLAVFESIVYG